MYIKKELISNKQTLSFENWKNIRCESYLLSVTRGMASSKQKQACYQQFIDELSDSEPVISNLYFKRDNNFELWCENELIGLCHNTASVEDWLGLAKSTSEAPETKDEGTLFLTCSLDAVFIIKKYRGKELSDYFAKVISKAQWLNFFGLLAHLKIKNIEHVEAVFFCGYYSKDEEHFHQSLYADSTGDDIKSTIAELGCTYEASIDSGF
ncbi:MAG: hypothetical protein OQK09_13770 [Colwellia sp.]|nr:hypothetical protein [Colwellia sp.]MCW9082575.1 hypothetical protein [Colwellia sp.]